MPHPTPECSPERVRTPITTPTCPVCKTALLTGRQSVCSARCRAARSRQAKRVVGQFEMRKIGHGLGFSCLCLSGHLLLGMAKKKQSESDVNVTAFEILQAVTGEPAHSHNGSDKPAKKKSLPVKNPAAVALGRLGGLKGGKARMAKLSANRRSEIAKKAALARWKSS